MRIKVKKIISFGLVISCLMQGMVTYAAENVNRDAENEQTVSDENDVRFIRAYFSILVTGKDYLR